MPNFIKIAGEAVELFKRTQRLLVNKRFTHWDGQRTDWNKSNYQ
jgi:hypothetical protein